MTDAEIRREIDAVRGEIKNLRSELVSAVLNNQRGYTMRCINIESDLSKLERTINETQRWARRVAAFVVAVCVCALVTIMILLCFAPSASAGYFDSAEATKASAHTMAEAARALGYAEDSAIIQAAKGHYNAAQEQIDAELDMLARVVYFEAGSSWISDRHQQLVACVLLNRCADERFPATIEGNVYRKGQYSCSGRLYTVSREAIPARCYDNARAAAYGEVECPAGVIYQAQFKQGKRTYAHIGNTYFCYG